MYMLDVLAFLTFALIQDHVNRSISMKLLIDEALENAGRQFIFLTPLGLDKQQLRDDGNGNQLKDALSIFKFGIFIIPIKQRIF